MERLKNFLGHLSKNQKIGIMLVPILVVTIVVAILIVMNILSEPKIEIEFEGKVSIPGAEIRQMKEKMLGVIETNTEDFDKNTIYVGKARDYEEGTEDDFTTATFIVDFDDIRQSYSVAVTWPDPDDGSPNIYISCPLDDSKYPEASCVTQSNSSKDISRFLPYTGVLDTGEEYTVTNEYDAGVPYIEIQIDSCGNKALLESALNSAREWILSLNLDPDDYLTFVPPDICSTSPISAEFPYIMANHTKTNDDNVNAYLPYYVPSAYYVYPVVDDNNDVVSIKAEIPGCMEYQREPAEELVMNYLKNVQIEYPVEFTACEESVF